MCSIFVRFPFLKGYSCFTIEDSGVGVEHGKLRSKILMLLGSADFLMYYNGKEIVESQIIPPNAVIHISFTLPGGKGGFGSMLRAIGAQIEKTTNREACRDLSGRRLRDINEEQRLKKWISKKSEREAEKIRRRKERIERLKSKPKHNFVDFEYEKEISALPERIDEALAAGMEKAKRPLEAPQPSTSSSKKKRLWLDEDISSTSDSDSDFAKNSSDSLPSGSIESENEACCSKEFRSEASETLVSSNSSCDSKSSEKLLTDSVLQKTSMNSDDSSSDKQDSHQICQEKLAEPENNQETVVQPESSQEITSTTIDSLENISHLETDQKEGKLIESTTNQKVTFQPETSQETTNAPGIGLENITDPGIDEKDKNSIEHNPETSKESLVKDKDSPIDLLEFTSAAELEVLGLERLKSDLMMRGLKCGGNITDRAKRLWAVRCLEPNQYPKNLFAKQKK